jgi:hypothetical protein
MSDDILTVETQFANVVSLAQGYVNRADGERLLLPLPEAYTEGSGLRFVVLLADGTPAFAGAGLCSQVSDQGATVPADQRYETLLDTLQFDERSRPVYEYIVAVRNAQYAQAAEGEEEAHAEIEAAEVDEYHAADDQDGVISGDAPEQSYGEQSAQVLWSAEQGSAYEPESQASWAPSAPPPGMDAERAAPSFIPPSVPTGLLTRPARVAHWQPAPPRRPTPRPITGMFRYPAGPLPKPARPPRPQLDPSLRVRPAPKP